jgi:hypothetical protein
MQGVRGVTTPKFKPKPLKHGLTTLRSAINKVGNRVIDRRTVVGKALLQWRGDLITDLGNDVSTQQAAIIDVCIRTKLMLDSIDAWLLTQPRLINGRTKSVLPVVMQRQAIAAEYRAALKDLGLKRIEKNLSLDQYLEQQQSDKEQDGGDKT